VSISHADESETPGEITDMVCPLRSSTKALAIVGHAKILDRVTRNRKDKVDSASCFTLGGGGRAWLTSKAADTGIQKGPCSSHATKLAAWRALCNDFAVLCNHDCERDKGKGKGCRWGD
jgi:hypothetical protein